MLLLGFIWYFQRFIRRSGSQRTCIHSSWLQMLCHLFKHNSLDIDIAPHCALANCIIKNTKISMSNIFASIFGSTNVFIWLFLMYIAILFTKQISGLRNFWLILRKDLIFHREKQWLIIIISTTNFIIFQKKLKLVVDMKILTKSKASDCQELFRVNEVIERQIYENEILIFGHSYVRCGIQFFHILNANCWLCLSFVCFLFRSIQCYQTNMMEIYIKSIQWNYFIKICPSSIKIIKKLLKWTRKLIDSHGSLNIWWQK